MRILGIDPGLGIVGYGIVDSEKGESKVVDYGVIRTAKEKTVPQRLIQIYDTLNELLDKYKPDCVAVEELFFLKNITTGISVAEARGVILLACKQYLGDNLFEYTPMQIKMALTGYGRAEKAQIQYMVKNILKLKALPKPDDAADALAVAITHVQSGRLGNLFKIKGFND